MRDPKGTFLSIADVMAWFAFVLVGRVALAASTAIIVANVRRPKVQTTRQPRAMPTKASGSVRKSHELRLLFSETGLANGAETSRS